eukprot:Phypoly_transcript_06781.p1 GENE.Phypoly_transcript_06781~~Phypoly_transcript_06781.p1  ORF type:complete len:574 (+),score=91.52 Phypoly_transcript_06781:50-1723(+)
MGTGMKVERDDTSLLGGPASHSASRRKKVVLIVGAALVVSMIIIGVSIAIYYKTEDAKNVSLADSLEVQNVMGHLTQLLAIAYSAGNGSRSVVDAYNASAHYVIDTLSKTGDFCNIQTQYFNVPIYEELSSPTLTQTAPFNISYVLGRDFSGTRYGGNGTYDLSATAIVAANNGCNLTDFQGNFTGNFAVVFDGACTQYQKALNAEQVGAIAILIVNNKGNPLANWRVRSVTWNDTTQLVQIPVLGITYSLGLTLQEQAGTSLRLSTNTTVYVANTFNVFCLTKHGSADEIIVMGAHLDSVPEGPGINDNGSGSSTILEVALEMERRRLAFKSKILFAWWGAEEIGLLGSRYFVNQMITQGQEGHPTPPFSQTDYLPTLTANNTLLNLNFDMLGSPNYVRQVQNSTAQTPRVNDASYRIEQLFEEFFATRRTSYEITPMVSGSDFVPFIENGWPAGALATGAGAIKTVAERDVYGGLANAPLDPCYHLSCDTTANIAQDVLQDMSKAAAYVVQKLAEQNNLRNFLYGVKPVSSGYKNPVDWSVQVLVAFIVCMFVYL